MDPVSDIRSRLLRIASTPSADLAEGALLISAEENSSLDVAESLDVIDGIAASASDRRRAAAEA
ncbi:MAG: hypothetical protein ACKOCT_06895, partial [Alphaproteobacteria bacterium]